MSSISRLETVYSPKFFARFKFSFSVFVTLPISDSSIQVEIPKRHSKDAAGDCLRTWFPLTRKMTKVSEAAQKFAKLFYENYDKDRNKLKGFFLENSQLVWNGNSVANVDNILTFLNNLPSSSTEVVCLDVQVDRPRVSTVSITFSLNTYFSTQTNINASSFFRRSTSLSRRRRLRWWWRRRGKSSFKAGRMPPFTRHSSWRKVITSGKLCQRFFAFKTVVVHLDISSLSLSCCFVIKDVLC